MLLNKLWVVGFLFIIWFERCHSPVVFTEKVYFLNHDDSIYVNDLNVSIVNKGCGRQWRSGKGGPPFETVWCLIQVRHKNEPVQVLNSEGKIYSGEAEITVEKVNPGGAIEDSIPPGGCRIRVKWDAETHR